MRFFAHTHIIHESMMLPYMSCFQMATRISQYRCIENIMHRLCDGAILRFALTGYHTPPPTPPRSVRVYSHSMHVYVVYMHIISKYQLTWFYLHLGDVYVPALWQGPLDSHQNKFPVVVFSHGVGGNRTTYTTICCELASRGFVVAAIEHRYAFLPKFWHNV